MEMFIALIIALPIAFVIGKVVLAINGKDDGEPWPHDAMRDHWRD